METCLSSIENALSVYVHFPWCVRKCPYCDFASLRIEPSNIPQQTYTDAVLRELEQRAAHSVDKKLISIFFGGGTPSLWEPKELGRVLKAISQLFSVNEETIEITVECNPSSLDEKKAAALRDVGVNRLSVGVQSLNAAHLKYLGRSHDAQKALESLRAAVSQVGRVSADMIFGLPGQTSVAWVEELQLLLECGIEHLSAYALTIEAGTQFGELHRKNRLPVATDDSFAELFQITEAVLRERGFEHYEISNYARVGQESVHNQHYWRGGAYLGLGAGAVGSLHNGYGRARRYRNEADPTNYLAHKTLQELEVFEETLSAEDLLREALMLGLRTRNGVNAMELQERLGLQLAEIRQAALQRRTARNDVVFENNILHIPQQRWLQLDSIVVDFF